MRIAFATAPTEEIGHIDEDRPLHEGAATSAGWDVEYPVWSDPAVQWADFDLVVVRSTWNYLDHLEAFRAWVARVGALGILENPAGTVLWNLDKRYLRDLAGLGLPVVLGSVCTRIDALPASLAAVNGEVVIKPVVSAGARSTGRFEGDDPAASELARAILASGVPVLVQPAVASLASEGEISTIVIDGRISHSVRKGPILASGGGLVGGTYTERIAPVDPLDGVLDLVSQTVRAVERVAGSRGWGKDPLLYARVDIAFLDDGTASLLEVELAEPALFLDQSPGAADLFAEAVVRRARARRAARVRSESPMTGQ